MPFACEACLSSAYHAPVYRPVYDPFCRPPLVSPLTPPPPFQTYVGCSCAYLIHWLHQASFLSSQFFEHPLRIFLFLIPAPSGLSPPVVIGFLYVSQSSLSFWTEPSVLACWSGSCPHSGISSWSLCQGHMVQLFFSMRRGIRKDNLHIRPSRIN